MLVCGDEGSMSSSGSGNVVGLDTVGMGVGPGAGPGAGIAGLNETGGFEAVTT